jgi:hypothetical protein
LSLPQASGVGDADPRAGRSACFRVGAPARPLAEHFLAATVSSVACRWGHWWWKRQNRVVRSSRPVMRWSRAARSLPFPALRKMHRQQGATVCFNRVPSWS